MACSRASSLTTLFGYVATNFIIAAADTCMRMTNTELLAAEFPGCQLTPGTGDHDTLLSIAKARRMLGFAPRFSWRTV